MGLRVTNTTKREYYTVPEAARLLSVSPSTIWRWIKSGKLTAYRVGERSIRISHRDLESVISPIRAPEETHKLFENYDPEAVLAAIEATAGSWSDIDADQFIADLYAAREEGSRPMNRP